MLPSNGQTARGDAPFHATATPGQVYRFFADTASLPAPAPDGAMVITRDLVEILQAGDNMSIPVRIVTPEWLDANPAAAQAYEAWKRGRSVDAGTPLDAWAGIDRHMVAACAVYNTYTVEQLAALDDERLLRLGMGARDLRERARLYLDSRADAQATQRVLAEKDAMAAQMAAMEAQMRQQQEMMARMAAEMDAMKAATTPPPQDIDAAPQESVAPGKRQTQSAKAAA